MNTLVVAACNGEDTSWIGKTGRWYPVVEDSYQPEGREATAYLSYIIHRNAWSWPRGDVVFCQGNPFSHDPEFLAHLEDPSVHYYGPTESCDKDGEPPGNWMPLWSWSDVLSLPKQDSYTFVAGAQYRLTEEQVKRRPWDFYNALYYLTLLPDNKSAWVLERLWPVIWMIDL